MNEAALEQLSDECARRNCFLWFGKDRRRRIVAAVVKHAPSREYIQQVGIEQAHKELKQAAIIELFIFSVIWEVAVSLVAWLILRWILDNGKQARWIEQARAA